MILDDVLSGKERWCVGCGNSLAMLKRIPAASVHCCVTSPPYFQLRSYGLQPTPWPEITYSPMPGSPQIVVEAQKAVLGMEKTPEAYVGHLIAILREVKRVLRKDGTFWLNVGHTIQEKQNLGIPWRIAFAMQADGWLVNECIWSKNCPLPTSIPDRPMAAHEMIFMCMPSKKYFYDRDAVKFPMADSSLSRYQYEMGGAKAKEINSPMVSGGQPRQVGFRKPSENGRQLWSDWNDLEKNAPDVLAALVQSLDEQGFLDETLTDIWPDLTAEFSKLKHYAPFPSSLPERCIKLGTSAHGTCNRCGAPYVRLTQRTKLKRDRPSDFTKRTGEEGTGNVCPNTVAGVSVTTLGWEQSCACNADVEQAIVLDPFCGSGTTGVVARQLSRRFIGLEISQEYAQMARTRIASAAPLDDVIAREQKKKDHPLLFEDE